MHDYMGFGKFKDIDAQFHKNVQELLSVEHDQIDFIHHFSIYTGHVNIARYLFFYDLYKEVRHLSGHIADIGTWKGASFFWFVKLIKLFESFSQTQVHGFDWFKGMVPNPGEDDLAQNGLYSCSYEKIQQLIKIQNLQDIALVHKLDLVNDLGPFFKVYPYLRFKMIFIDCGIAAVLRQSLEYFWPRLVYGGILIVDHYNCESSPSESDVLEKFIGKNHIRHCPFNRQPTGYVIKEF